MIAPETALPPFLPYVEKDVEVSFRDSNSSDFGIEIEERFQAGAKLALDIFLAAFEDVHRDMCLVTVLELNRRFPDGNDLVGRQQPQSVNEYKVGHTNHCTEYCVPRGESKRAGFARCSLRRSSLDYNSEFMRTVLVITALALATTVAAQEKGPPVKLTVLNVCSPTTAEQKEIASALARVPRQPRFSSDFEVARGHTTVDHSASNWVRVRRDMAEGQFTGAQYVYTREGELSRETVVFFSKDTKDVSQIALEDSVTAPVQPASLLASHTPANRISLERIGKPHLVLERCPNANQAAMEPLFTAASELMDAYRVGTGAREIVPAEVGRLGLGVGPGYRPPKVKPMGKR